MNQDLSDASGPGVEKYEELALHSQRHALSLLNAADFKSLFDQVQAGIFVARNGRFLYVNHALAALFGYGVQDMVSTVGSTDLAAPEDRELVLKHVRDRVAGRNEGGYDIQCQRRDGSRFSARVWGVRVPLGRLEVDLVTVHDISEMQAALDASKQRSRLLQQAERLGCLGSAEQDLLTGEVHLSEGMFRLFDEQPQAGSVSQSWLVDRILTEDRALAQSIYDRAKPGEPHEAQHRIVRADGQQRIVRHRGAVELDQSGRPSRALSVIQDVTEHLSTSEALQLSETMLDRAPVLILSADEDGNLVYVNDAACKTLGHEREKFLSMKIFEIAPHRRADTWPATVAALKQLGSKTFESDWCAANGHIVPVEISATYMLHEGNGYVVIYGTDITSRKEAELQALRLAHFDDITGLPNRTLLQDRLKAAAAQSLREGRSISVLAIEIERLRRVNETMGHAAGDLLLKTLTQRILSGLRGADTVAHLGAGEFAVLMDRESDAGEEVALPQARAIIEALSSPVMIQGTEVYTSCTIGVTIYPQDGNQPDHILRQAQAALRIAHSQGTNQIGFYTPETNARVGTRLAMETALRRAIDQGDLDLYFQPQIDLSNGHIIGVEALIRWQHPELGVLEPATFLPVAEETGLAIALGDWVMRTACMTSVAWQCMGLPPIRMAINLSARQLQQPDIGRRIQAILMETGLNACHLGIEITESMLVEDIDLVAQALKALKTIGVEIALDDFGTGYSSLSHLRRLPIDMVKMDRSFVHDVTAATEDVSITRTIISMAHSLQIKVMAEGVETEGQLALLVANQCDQMQGSYFSNAVPAQDIEAMLQERRKLPQDSLGRKARTRTLLLVDDEDNIVSSLKRLLRRDGYHIVTANSGAQGLQRLAENEVDVIISDQRMPGMTGVEFLRRAKELYPQTVRLVLSGYTELQSITDAINEGAIYKFLTKPWDDERVRAHIAEAFTQKEMADENARLDREVQDANRELAEVNGRLQRLLETQREQMHRDETSLVIAREVLENIPAPVIGVDVEGTVAFLNTDAEALFSGSATPLGRHVEDAFDAGLLDVWHLSDGQYHQVFIVGRPYQAVCRPMSSESGSRGKLMVLTPDASTTLAH